MLYIKVQLVFPLARMSEPVVLCKTCIKDIDEYRRLLTLVVFVLNSEVSISLISCVKSAGSQRCKLLTHFSGHGRDMLAISVLWTIVSLILLFTCTLALFSPFWHEYIPDPMSSNNSESFIAFGLLRFCLQKQFVTLEEMNAWRDSRYCSFYDRIFPGIPSVFWKVAVNTYALALVLLLVAILLVHILCCQKFLCRKLVFAIAWVMQSIAVVLLLVSLTVYPFGLNSEFVKQQCGSTSGFFNSGTCQIAWGYLLAIVSTGLLLFCPMIAYHLSVSTPRSKATVV